MESNVSRLTSGGKLVIGRSPACVKCGRRPQRWSGGRWQSYCKICHAEDHRRRRDEQRQERERQALLGRTEAMALTPEERELLLELRGIEPAGRHHARLAAAYLCRPASLRGGIAPRQSEGKIQMRKIIAAIILAAGLALGASGVASAAIAPAAHAPLIGPAQHGTVCPHGHHHGHLPRGCHQHGR